jgi:hypothetical protein
LPKDPKGQKRPADEGNDKAAQSLRLRGGKARAESLTPGRRKAIQSWQPRRTIAEALSPPTQPRTTLATRLDRSHEAMYLFHAGIDPLRAQTFIDR